MFRFAPTGRFGTESLGFDVRLWLDTANAARADWAGRPAEAVVEFLKAKAKKRTSAQEAGLALRVLGVMGPQAPGGREVLLEALREAKQPAVVESAALGLLGAQKPDGPEVAALLGALGRNLAAHPPASAAPPDVNDDPQSPNRPMEAETRRARGDLTEEAVFLLVVLDNIAGSVDKAGDVVKALEKRRSSVAAAFAARLRPAAPEPTGSLFDSDSGGKRP